MLTENFDALLRGCLQAGLERWQMPIRQPTSIGEQTAHRLLIFALRWQFVCDAAEEGLKLCSYKPYE
jgi:hypothetical protein